MDKLDFYDSPLTISYLPLILLTLSHLYQSISQIHESEVSS